MTRTEFNEIEESEELAISFINGNRSYVRKKIGDSIKKFDAVMDILEKNYSKEDVKSFRKLICLGKE